MIPVLILATNLLYHSDALDAVAFEAWALLPLAVTVAVYAWISAFTERLALFVPTRITALDREIDRLGRQQTLAQELIDAQQAK
ncbi:MAG: hypothetical protein FWF71_07615 [Actinomycetia bacterium]|nr:hypothetical protein [Actinomycetes bacterium]